MKNQANQTRTRNLPEVLPPGEGYWEACKAYADFIEGIDSSVAGTDDYGDLSWHIDCSARANGYGNTGAELERSCLDPAIMILGCWEDFYPWLVLPQALANTKPEPPTERRVVRAQSLYTGDEYWVYDDDGSPVPYSETPEARWDEIQYLWHIREDGYPCGEDGFPFCSECGQDVTAKNFYTGDDPGMKDYCEECAQRELDRRD